MIQLPSIFLEFNCLFKDLFDESSLAIVENFAATDDFLESIWFDPNDPKPWNSQYDAATSFALARNMMMHPYRESADCNV